MIPMIELGAVISSAAFGALRAVRRQMDFVGVFWIAFLTAFGGGTLRDLFLDRQPLYWIANPRHVVLVFALAAAASLVPRSIIAMERLLAFPDALGLGLFSVVGVSIARDANVDPFPAVLIGVITGTFGGVLADVACNRVPDLFRPAPLCATCAFAGGWLMYGLERLTDDRELVLFLSAGFVVLSRLASLRWNIGLPAVRHGEAATDD
jgi:uncharacterized membrane protein YeiH